MVEVRLFKQNQDSIDISASRTPSIPTIFSSESVPAYQSSVIDKLAKTIRLKNENYNTSSKLFNILVATNIVLFVAIFFLWFQLRFFNKTGFIFEGFKQAIINRTNTELTDKLALYLNEEGKLVFETNLFGLLYMKGNEASVKELKINLLFTET